MSTHTRPGTTGGARLESIPCDGVFEWANVHFDDGTTEIRRECPWCGRRELWRRYWHQHTTNLSPGDTAGFLRPKTHVWRMGEKTP